MKRSSKSFEIALSALACAVAAVGLTLGAYLSNFFLAGGYLLAVFALMVPLSKRFYWGYALAFLGASLLAFFCGGMAAAIWTLLPFVAFFGLHPLANALQMRFFKRKIWYLPAFVGKALWFDGALLLIWFTLGGALGFPSATWYPFVAQYLYYIVFFGGTALFAFYDGMIFLCQRSVDAVIRRIGR